MSEDNKALYPFKFLPSVFEQPWGSQIYQLADLGAVDTMVESGWLGGNTLSELMETFLERISGPTGFEYYGTQFPVSIKSLSVTGRTPVMVGVDDTQAADRYDAFGKTALWYVTEASDDARIYLGFQRDVRADEFYRRCLEGSLPEIMQAWKPRVGECYFLRPGLVHAATGPLKLIEISEASELFFRVSEWGPAAGELEAVEALDLVDLTAYEREMPHVHETGHEPVTETLADCPQFRLTELHLSDALHIYSEQFESFLLYRCVEGEALLQIPSEDGRHMDSYAIKKDECLLVPAEIEDFFLVPADRHTRLLEVVMPKREDPDPYVDEEEDGCEDPECEEHHHHHHHHHHHED